MSKENRISNNSSDHETETAFALDDPTATRVRTDLFKIVRSRIRLDQSHAPSAALKALLHVIDRHLGNEHLNVTWAKTEVGIRNNSEALFFHIEFGLPPGRYIEACKLDIAAGLLALTDAPIWRIAATVGYAGMPTFSRAFHRRFGLRPRSARQRYRAAQAQSSLTTTAQNLLDTATRGQSKVRRRHEILTVQQKGRWSPLIHSLEGTLATARSDQRDQAMGYALNLLRLLELGLEPSGAHALSLGIAPQVVETAIGLRIDGVAVTRLLAGEHPAPNYAAEVITTLQKSLAR
ncbi:MAG: helix-turn-helix domain-containing protein [Acidobacteriota bacterium]